MPRLRIDIAGSPRELRAGLRTLAGFRSKRLTLTGRGPVVRFEKAGDGVARSFEVSPAATGGAFTVRYAAVSDAFRALGCLLGHAGGRGPVPAFDGHRSFAKLGFMLDFSRNGVMHVDALKAYLNAAALMGYNVFLPYIEDTYEVPGEPYWGYQRGRYTRTEMRAIAAHATALGIDVVPIIQTWGHAGQILQWPPYKNMRRGRHDFRAGNEAVYRLLEKAIRTVADGFHARRVHVGMDEVGNLGEGEPGRIFLAHLRRITGICRSVGVRPLIWGDVPFRIFRKGGGAFYRKTAFPSWFRRGLPRGVPLICWEYCQPDARAMAAEIQAVQELGDVPVASGSWTWSRLWTHTPYANSTATALVAACRARKVSEVMTTLWGDDGQECPFGSAMAALQFLAEHAWTKHPEDVQIRRNFKGIHDADYDDWVHASDIDTMQPLVTDDSQNAATTSKWLLWQDPLIPLMHPQLHEVSLRRHYARMAQELEIAARRSAGAALLRFPAQIARTLALKCDLAADIRKAYAAGNRAMLARIARGVIPAVQKEVAALRKCHRSVWMAEFKPFGWEVLDIRYGGVLARMDTARERITDFLAGRLAALPECTQPLLPVFPAQPRGTLPANVTYGRVKTTSMEG